MAYRLQYGGMTLGQEEKDAIMEVVDENWWPLGKRGIILEKESADYLGIKHCTLANSGSSAGLLALTALELPKGSEVIIPAVTFPTIFNIIVQCGLKPVVADCEVGTYSLDLDQVEKLIGRKTRAIIAVHPVGNPVDMPRLMRLADKVNRKRKKKLYVLEDNCDGWGGSMGGVKLGTFADISFTSFHAAHIGSSMGQGGATFTNSDELDRKVKMYRDWGRQTNTETRTNGDKWPELPPDQDSRFIYEKIGYNLSPLELQAAMGRVQLRRVEDTKEARRKNYEYFREHLSKYPELIMPKVVAGAEPSWFALPLTYTGDRGALVKHLEDNGIETRSMFTGNVLRHPAYKNVKHRKGNLDQADYILHKSFWVGVHQSYTQEDREYMIKTFDDYLGKHNASSD
jgi:CDP-4-dehydro-6-deoxyglucose reductase, E1